MAVWSINANNSNKQTDKRTKKVANERKKKVFDFSTTNAQIKQYRWAELSFLAMIFVINNAQSHTHTLSHIHLCKRMEYEEGAYE